MKKETPADKRITIPFNTEFQRVINHLELIGVIDADSTGAGVNRIVEGFLRDCWDNGTIQPYMVTDTCWWEWLGSDTPFQGCEGHDLAQKIGELADKAESISAPPLPY